MPSRCRKSLGPARRWRRWSEPGRGPGDAGSASGIRDANHTLKDGPEERLSLADRACASLTRLDQVRKILGLASIMLACRLAALTGAGCRKSSAARSDRCATTLSRCPPRGISCIFADPARRLREASGRQRAEAPGQRGNQKGDRANRPRPGNRREDWHFCLASLLKDRPEVSGQRWSNEFSPFSDIPRGLRPLGTALPWQAWRSVALAVPDRPEGSPGPILIGQARRSKRSASITLTQAETKSQTNFSRLSSWA